MTNPRQLLEQYGRLAEIPLDIQYSIFLNAPADTLDDLCQRQLFVPWCQEPKYLEAYLQHQYPDLLKVPEAPLVAITNLHSKLLSMYLLDRVVHTIEPIDLNSIPMDDNPFYVANHVIQWVENTNFEPVNTDSITFRVKDLLSAITNYRIASKRLMRNLYILSEMIKLQRRYKTVYVSRTGKYYYYPRGSNNKVYIHMQFNISIADQISELSPDQIGILSNLYLVDYLIALSNYIRSIINSLVIADY